MNNNNYRRIRQSGILLGVLLVTSFASLAASASTLRSINVASAGANAAVIDLVFTGPAPKPSIFSVHDSGQIALDLPGAQTAASVDNDALSRGPVQSVRAATVNSGVRVVVQLDQAMPHQVVRSARDIKLFVNTQPGSSRPALADGASSGINVTRLGSGESGANPAPRDQRNAGTSPASYTHTQSRSQTAQGAAGRAGSADGARRVEHIDFRRAGNEAGRVVVALNTANAPVSISRKNGHVVATLSDTTLPARLQKRLDVRDFATPVDTIDAVQKGDNAQFIITPSPGTDFTQLAYETANKVNIELRPMGGSTAGGGQKSQKPKYTGKKISLSFQDISVRKLLQILASVANVNMVVSGQVGGQMSLRLQNVPWDQALHIILRARGLGKQRNNNVITVAPLAQMAARDKAEKAAQQATQSLQPIRSQIITLNYAKASDIARLLKARTAGADNSLLSSRGQVNVDKRTNSLIVNATREHIDAIQRLVHHLDKPQQQVLVQARIVVANRDFSRDLGSQFNVRGANNKAGTGPGGNQLSGGGNSAGQVNEGGFSVALPASNPAGQLATSIITGHMNIGLVLNAMQKEDRGKVVSSPRVITANGQEAIISKGTQIPYLQAASSGAATVSFKKAVLSLKVTPRITPDNHVIMDLDVKKDSRGQDINTLGGGTEPAIDTQRLKTRVRVDNGNTVVLGGIYTREDTNVRNSVPFFGDIPILGHLFENNNRKHNRRELLLFITPRVLKSNLSNTQ